MPVSLGFWKWKCPNRGNAHITVTAHFSHQFSHGFLKISGTWNRLWVGRQLSRKNNRTMWQTFYPHPPPEKKCIALSSISMWTTSRIPKGNWKQWLCKILGVNRCLVVFEKMANSWNPTSLSKRGSSKNYVLSAKESCLYDKRNEKWDYTHIKKGVGQWHCLSACIRHDKVIPTHFCVFGWDLNMRPLKWMLLRNSLFCGSSKF